MFVPDVKHFDPDDVLATLVHLFWEQGAAATGIQRVVAATGVSRSSLYATFGGKQELYVAALRRYVEEQSRPTVARLAADERGLPAIAGFFQQLIQVRCSGEHAHWGCMVSNAHVGTERGDPDVRQALDLYHRELREAFRTALRTAREHGQLRADVDLDAAAELLTLVAYGVNVRSRVGVEAADLYASVTAVLESLGGRRPA